MNQKEALDRLENFMNLRGLREKTKNQYNRSVKKFFEFTSVKDTSEIDVSMALDFLIYLDTEYSYAPRTHNVYVYGLRSFFKGVLGVDADKLLPKKKMEIKPRAIFTPKEARILFENCEDPRLKAAIGLAFGCGLRACEVVNLRFKDVNKFSMILTIYDSKGQKGRMMKYRKTLATAMNSYTCWARLHRRKSDDFIFPSKKPGHHLSSQTLASDFKEYIQAFEFTLPEHSFHALRHSFATRLANDGVPLPVIQYLMGHKSAATTAGYIHLTEDPFEMIPDVLLGDEEDD